MIAWWWLKNTDSWDFPWTSCFTDGLTELIVSIQENAGGSNRCTMNQPAIPEASLCCALQKVHVWSSSKKSHIMMHKAEWVRQVVITEKGTKLWIVLHLFLIKKKQKNKTSRCNSHMILLQGCQMFTFKYSNLSERLLIQEHSYLLILMAMTWIQHLTQQ